jgi:hypothetical protein
MDREEHIHMVRQMCNQNRERLIAEIKNGCIPREWTGAELKLLLSERFGAGTGSLNLFQKSQYYLTRSKQYL